VLQTKKVDTPRTTAAEEMDGMWSRMTTSEGSGAQIPWS
jgi:hypothetical protein